MGDDFERDLGALRADIDDVLHCAPEAEYMAVGVPDNPEEDMTYWILNFQNFTGRPIKITIEAL